MSINSTDPVKLQKEQAKIQQQQSKKAAKKTAPIGGKERG